MRQHAPLIVAVPFYNNQCYRTTSVPSSQYLEATCFSRANKQVVNNSLLWAFQTIHLSNIQKCMAALKAELIQQMQQKAQPERNLSQDPSQSTGGKLETHPT